MIGNPVPKKFARPLLAALVALSSASALVAVAQDEAAPAAAAPAADAKRVPRPSEIAVRATSNPLLKVVDTGQRYVAVGARGHIVTSSDGKNWTQVASPVDVLLTSVAFADANNGWAVGHDATILHTSDGGQTWKLQNYQPDLNKPLFDVLFTDANTGFAVGAYGLMLETTDGGTTWTQADAPAILEGEKHLNALARLGDGSLMVVGEAGLIGVSPDGGKTWTKTESPYTSSLFAVLAAGEKGATIAGLRGSSFWTENVHAPKWSRLNTRSTQSLFGIAVLPGNQLGMVGLNGTLLLFDASGDVHEQPILDKNGYRQSDSISWLTVAKDGGVILVGDAGVQHIDVQRKP